MTTTPSPTCGGDDAIAREAIEAAEYEERRADRRLAGWQRRQASRPLAA